MVFVDKQRYAPPKENFRGAYLFYGIRARNISLLCSYIFILRLFDDKHDACYDRACQDDICNDQQNDRDGRERELRDRNAEICRVTVIFAVLLIVFISVPAVCPAYQNYLRIFEPFQILKKLSACK